MKKDENGNWPYKLAMLRDRNRDLSKEWYIEYYVYCDICDAINLPKAILTETISN